MARIASQAVAGFYPTPPALLPAIARRIACGTTASHATHYPLVYADPCAGTGAALAALAEDVTPKLTAQRFLACELEGSRYQALLARDHEWKTAFGDAFRLKFPQKQASVLYLNPPYDLDAEYKRLEQRFLQRFTSLLLYGGVLVFVVPVHALTASAEYLARHYKTLSCYRFPKGEYEAFKQVVLFAERCTERMVPDAEMLAEIAGYVAAAETLPTLLDPPDYVYTVPREYFGTVEWSIQATDYMALLGRYVPFYRGDGNALQKTPILPPAPDSLGLRLFPSALPPKPAHLAAGIASGVFDGVQLSPDDPKSGLPNVLVKGVFDREYVPVEEKVNKEGEVVGVVEVQQPKLTVTALDLTTLQYHSILPDSSRSETFSLKGATTADLLTWYSKTMLKSLLDHCPVIHDPGNAEHVIELAPSKRVLYEAQKHAAMAAVKLLGGSGASKAKRRYMSAFLLGEIGCGKSSTALVAARTCGAKKVLVFCPPHLLDGWRDQVNETFDDADVFVLSNVHDVDAFAAFEPKHFAVAIVSREMAKLSHAIEPSGVLSSKIRPHCSHCGADLPAGDLAKSRARCKNITRTPANRFSEQYARFFWFAAPVTAAALSDSDLPMVGGHQVQTLKRYAKKWKDATPEQQIALATKIGSDTRLRAYLRVVVDHALTLRPDHKSTANQHALTAIFNLAAQVLTPEYAVTLIERCAAYHESLEGKDYYASSQVRHVAEWLYAAAPSDAAEAVFAPLLKTLTASYYGSSSPDPLKSAIAYCVENETNKSSEFPWLTTLREARANTVTRRIQEVVSHLYPLASFTAGAPCDAPLFQAHPAPRRVSLASYIVARHKNLCDFLVADECFPGDTLISVPGGTRPIADIQVGDMVWTRTPSGERVLRRVLNKFKKTPTRGLVRVTYEGGHVDCTPEHRFWSEDQQDYVPATGLVGVVQHSSDPDTTNQSMCYLQHDVFVYPSAGSRPANVRHGLRRQVVGFDEGGTPESTKGYGCATSDESLRTVREGVSVCSPSNTRGSVLQPGVWWAESAGASVPAENTAAVVRDRVRIVRDRADGARRPEAVSVLFAGVSIQGTGIEGPVDTRAPEASVRRREDARNSRVQSVQFRARETDQLRSCDSGENISDDEGTPIRESRWERVSHARSENTGGCVGLADGGCDCDGQPLVARRGGGSGTSDTQGSGGVRRILASHGETTEPRSAEGCDVAGTRMGRSTLLEFQDHGGSSSRTGGDPDCRRVGVISVEPIVRADVTEVWDLEIEDTHCYYAGGILVHNCHDLNSDTSAQATAGHRLAALGWPTLYLTGSVMNGYAESLFNNLWAISPKFREEFPYGARKAFIDRYGYRKRLVTQKDKEGKVVAYGAQSDRVEKSERDVGNAPGVLPLLVLRHLLPVAVTLHKIDLRLNLPPCKEFAVPVKPSSELVSTHERLKNALFTKIRSDAFTPRAGKLWGQVAELPGHMDRASLDTGNAEHGVYEICYPDGEFVTRAAPVVDANTLLPKEQWVLDKVRDELAEGRRVLVLTYHTNVMPRLARLIEKLLNEPVVTLLASKVPTAKRQAWIDKEVIGKKRRVLIANPTTIQTGLNNLVWFSTQVWVENPACNGITYRQTVGRSDRIGQKASETRVFFPYYEKGGQEAMQTLLAQKVSISMATDGIDPESAMEAAGMSQDLTLAALSVGRQLYRMMGGEL